MSTSISIKELKELDPSSYQIVDIRDAVEISHGAIPGGRRGEESPQKIQKVDLVQIYESDQHIRAGKTGR